MYILTFTHNNNKDHISLHYINMLHYMLLFYNKELINRFSYTNIKYEII